MSVAEAVRTTADTVDDAEVRVGPAGDFERQTVPLLKPLYRHAMRMTGNHADAEDLLQETLAKAYAGLHTFREGSNFSGWIHRILVNSYINGYRRRQRQPMAYSLHDVTDQQVVEGARHSSTGLRSAEDQALDTLPDTQIAAAFRALPEQFRTAIYYADIEGFRYKEIAAIMNTPLGTVVSRLNRGRRLLRGLLADVAEQRGYELPKSA